MTEPLNTLKRETYFDINFPNPILAQMNICDNLFFLKKEVLESHFDYLNYKFFWYTKP